MIAPDTIRGFVRPDAIGTAQHDEQMHRSEKEHREAGEDLPEPQRRVFVTHHPHVPTKRLVLAVIDRKLAHGKESMRDDQRDDQRHHDGDDPGIGDAEEKIAFEKSGDGPHRILAEQNRRHEEHVAPHEEHQEQSGDALPPVEPRRPAARAHAVCHSHARDQRTRAVHWRISFQLIPAALASSGLTTAYRRPTLHTRRPR